MNIWEWLGIPPTTDIAKIKSAYARQAKLYHPEEHPEEFKALQKAYKEAVQRVRSQNARTSNIPREQPTDITGQKTEREQTADITGQRTERGQTADMSGQRAEQEQTADMSGQRIERGQAEEGPEYSFDYSGVDAYGDRERFFKQFLLISRSPYLRNNLHAWEYFLHQDAYCKLFENTDFRIRFVRAVCGVTGWRRKTILYFQKFLLPFHTEQNLPTDGKQETDLMCFRLRKLPHFRLPAFFMDRFWGKEGRDFHKQIHSKISREMGRELDLEMQSDVIRYMKQYFISAESKEDFVEHLHKGWNAQQIKWAAAGIVIWLALLLSHRYSVEKEYREAEDLIRADYLMRLYGLESGSCSREEQMKMLRDYDWDWENAEDAIDDVLERYENWNVE